MNRILLILSMMLAVAGCGDRSVFGLADASMDAAMADAGHDAGPLDLGRDAGPFDAGDEDAGSDDLGFDAASDDLGFDAASGDLGFDAASDDLGIDGALDDGGPSDLGFDGGPDDGGRLGPAPVILGSITDLTQAGAYVLIGKTGMSNVTGSMISGGHVGVSPAAASTLTGFSLVVDPSGEFSTSPSVVPPAKVYASDYAVPTPTNLTSAILSMEGAYTDAAARLTPDFLNLASGNLGGLTLAPGLYTWASSVTIPSSVTISGNANDTWIFQITGDVDQSAATQIILGGDARAENIWWQVAGTVTLHADAHFEGVILCQTGITMQTGASLHGRALAQSLVALDDNAITAP